MKELFNILLIAVALSMDTFSLSLGLGTYSLEKKKILIISATVGIMHFVMPFLGDIIGEKLVKFFSLNHNFFLGCILLFIAGNLALEMRKKEEKILLAKQKEEEKGEIVITKTETGSNKGISGVIFELYKSDKVTKATDIDGKEIGLIKTDAKGNATISNLAYGTYYLKEIEAPNIYIKESQLLEVTVNKSQTEIEIDNMPITVLFSKRDSVTENIINGGKYRIEKESGELVTEFSIKEDYYELIMEPGNYKFIEVEAPKDYTNANINFNFNVANNGDVTITSEESQYYYVYEGITINILNDKIEKVVEVPKTGNNTNKTIIIVSLILIGVGITSIVIIKKKKITK